MYNDMIIIEELTLFIIKIALKNMASAVDDAKIGQGLTFTK